MVKSHQSRYEGDHQSPEASPLPRHIDGNPRVNIHRFIRDHPKTSL